MVTASVPVKARFNNITNIAFRQVYMVCVDIEFFVVRVARLKPWVDIQEIPTCHNYILWAVRVRNLDPAGSLESLDLNCPYPALLTLLTHTKHIPFASNLAFIQCF